MTNFEHYKDDILPIIKDGDNIAFDTDKNTIVPCPDQNCNYCLFHHHKINCNCTMVEWLYEEYKEPQQVDWTKIPVDTKIYVRDNDNQPWEPRYFSHYNSEDHIVYAFLGGATSWTTPPDPDCCESWLQAKLAEECDK